MTIELYQVDAFSNTVFSGNAAAVCPLDTWLPDAVLQQIAAENNLSETAFYVEKEGQYHIRWFTPLAEVDLCGHATLATAYVLFQVKKVKKTTLQLFSPRSGALQVTEEENWFVLNFPADEYHEMSLQGFEELFSAIPIKAYKGNSDYMFLFKTEDEVKNLKPNLSRISKLAARGVIATAKGNSYDFVSRFFAPQLGIDEDPVTGSAHTLLAPYWSKQLQKKEMTAMQISARSGLLKCIVLGNRVALKGQAVLYLKGEISI